MHLARSEGDRVSRSGEAVRPTRQAIADAPLLHGQALLLEMMRVHRWTGARLHLVFDLEHLATVSLGVHTEERQQPPAPLSIVRG